MKISKIVGIIILSSLVFLSGCYNSKNIDKPPNPDGIKEEENQDLGDNVDVEIDAIEELINSMTLEEKVGQLLIVGFEGEKMNEQIKGYIQDLHVGGLILFARNIKDENQSIELLNSIKEENSSSQIPLFLSVDEEGGSVSRLPHSFKKLPSAMTVGERNNKEISYEFGRVIGERVKALGFNMNFSPVLDINSNPNNPVVGRRAFGTTKFQVIDHGLEAMFGIRDSGVIPAVKHFPGHGDTAVDSHINLPRIDKTIDELEELEFAPFKEAIKNDVEMIMTAHILYPNVDEKYPATMSYKIIKELLRDKLNYKGVIVSDDMTMGAIMNNYTLEEGVLLFLKSGGDIALICHGEENPRKAIDRIIKAVNDKEISEEEIDNKLYRILSLKESYKLSEDKIQDIKLDDLNNRAEELINRL